ncbi:MAG: hypothetical protein KatS3mg110_4525 [Pirellulaceae bacterium]|nr:MAG: hypothetical protein KatS3mg110_4525 [Pirellulaceae bacterium]
MVTSMRRKRHESRKRPRPQSKIPPWPVAPVPDIPDFGKVTDSEELWQTILKWAGALFDWVHVWRIRNSEFFAALPQIEEQCRLMINIVEIEKAELFRNLLGKSEWYRDLLVRPHRVLARCLSETYQRDPEAEAEFRRALEIEPIHSGVFRDYVRFLLFRGRYVEAADLINNMDTRIITETGQDTISRDLLNWAFSFPQIGYAIRPDILRLCVAELSSWGDAMVTLGIKFSPTKLRPSRGEIMKLMCMGMLNAQPFDEVCARERTWITEEKYWKWWRRYRPWRLGLVLEAEPEDR